MNGPIETAELCPKCGAYWHSVGYHYVWTAQKINDELMPYLRSQGYWRKGNTDHALGNSQHV